MIIIFPIVLGLIFLVGAIAIGSVTFGLAAVGIATGAAINSTNQRRIKAMIYGGGVIGFTYVLLANVGALEHERDFEYFFTLMLMLTVNSPEFRRRPRVTFSAGFRTRRATASRF